MRTKWIKLNKPHSKKLGTLVFEKKMKDGLHNNLTDLITNLTGRILSVVEVEIFKHGLKHGITSGTSESERNIIAGYLRWNRIEWFMWKSDDDLCKKKE